MFFVQYVAEEVYTKVHIACVRVNMLALGNQLFKYYHMYTITYAPLRLSYCVG